LPNRRLLQDRLIHAIAGAERYSAKVAILFLDLDNFKKINDSMGHGLGDRFLKSVSERLNSIIRDSDTLARFGGDEFVVILEGSCKIDDLSSSCQRILEGFEEPIPVDEHVFFTSFSIGISVYPDDSKDPEELLRCADSAMYQAKAQGGSGYCFFTADLNSRTRERLLLETHLRKALERDQLRLHYQPQIDLFSGKMVGMEALMRWAHPEWGMISPGEFIPLAEETGMIVAFGEWALRTACKQGVDWQKKGHPAVRVSVNISARQFRHGKLVQTISEILRETGFEPGLLELEITESMVMDNVEEAILTMEKITSLGVNLAIDDFGTGYSSLQYLQRFPVRRLKIDRSFIQGSADDPHHAAITSAVIALSKTLDMKVVAEGVEMMKHLDFLLTRECDLGQGYLFAPPLPPEEISQALRDFEGNHEWKSRIEQVNNTR